MAGVRRKPIKSGKYQGWFTDYTGKRKFFVGTRSRTDTLRMAVRLEDEHRQVKLGYRPPPTSASKHRNRPFKDVVAEYLAWGGAQGGRGGRPWGQDHARKRRAHLAWWREHLKVATLADLGGILPRVEAALRKIRSAGKAGKTVAAYAEALCAFCRWCVDRSYMTEDPLQKLGSFDTTPETIRRTLSPEEMQRLLECCAPHRRVLYEVALCSGIRVRELRCLTVGALDTERGRLNLKAEWTKNRKPESHPLPLKLVAKLAVAASSKAPTDRLLRVPTHTARELDMDLQAAGIPKVTPDGKLDFHALRGVYISLVVEAGATVKEAQVLARHSTPALTMNTYARTQPGRLEEVVERATAPVLAAKCAHSVQHGMPRKQGPSLNPSTPRVYPTKEVVEAGGIEPPSRDSSVQASTCVVGLLHFAHQAPTDRIPLSQSQQRASPLSRGTKVRG